MVAVVTGNGLGLSGSSASVLGSGGQLGVAGTSGGDAAYVNAQTGNLVIQRQDELLIGRGPDIGIVRTYNSQGSFDFDNNDRWQLSLYRKLSTLVGTANSSGSSITRTGADGVVQVYTYDATQGSATQGKYVNREGGGSYDTLTYTSGSNSWTWVDGDSRLSESYSVSPADATQWRISAVTDLNGNALTYGYDGSGLINQITDANGETTQLVYNAASQLTQINLYTKDSSGVLATTPTTRVRYGYDSSNRLIRVETDLTPTDGSVADGKTYVTTYTYDGTPGGLLKLES